eukprot:SAG22_NODE_1053_length_5796_cov_8.764613_4_plen_108_part_00
MSSDSGGAGRRRAAAGSGGNPNPKTNAAKPPSARPDSGGRLKVEWTLEEKWKLFELVDKSGTGDWEGKAAQLGTGRSGNALYQWHLYHQDERAEIKRQYKKAKSSRA